MSTATDQRTRSLAALAQADFESEVEAEFGKK
jgi:hypothetical protein